MKLEVKKATTSKRNIIFIRDNSVGTGVGLTGLAFGTSGLKWYYWREDAGNAGGTAVTLVTATRGTWTAGGFKEIDSTNLPGFYEIGIPDAVFATGANWAGMLLFGAANMAPVSIEFQLVDYDPNDGIHLGITALPNAAAAASGGLLTVGTSSGQINPSGGAVSIVAGQLSVKKNQALSAFPFVMFNATGGPATGLTVAATRRIDSGSFASCANAVSEIGNGWYSIDLANTDLNGNTIALRFSAVGAVDSDYTIITQA